MVQVSRGARARRWRWCLGQEGARARRSVGEDTARPRGLWRHLPEGVLVHASSVASYLSSLALSSPRPSRGPPCGPQAGWPLQYRTPAFPLSPLVAARLLADRLCLAVYGRLIKGWGQIVQICRVTPSGGWCADGKTSTRRRVWPFSPSLKTLRLLSRLKKV